MTASKYARIELERRFLLAGVPAGAVLKGVDIDDRYLDGTRVRLRRQTGGAFVRATGGQIRSGVAEYGIELGALTT